MLTTPPYPDWADIRPTDTLLTWLTRTVPTYGWTTFDNGNGVAGQQDEWGHPDYEVYSARLTSEEFHRMYVRPLVAAPIWPGLANVTLGTPVALSSDLTVDGPLDGLIVSITTPPTGLGKFTFGGFTAYYKVGEVAFVDDNGDAEPWQYLAFDQALYCPKAMNRAASASLRVLAGAAGTATPWVVT